MEEAEMQHSYSRRSTQSHETVNRRRMRNIDILPRNHLPVSSPSSSSSSIYLLDHFSRLRPPAFTTKPQSSRSLSSHQYARFHHSLWPHCHHSCFWCCHPQGRRKHRRGRDPDRRLPDGYVYRVETEAYVEDTITTANGTTHTALVHPAFKRSVDMHGTSPNPSKKRLSYTHGYDDTCDDTTLVNKTSGASPKVSDCAAVCDYYRHDNGHFSASIFGAGLSDWCRLVITGTCVFGIKTKNSGSTDVGSSNIADPVDLSINSFQSGGRVGAEGETTYATWKAKTKWAIFSK